MATTLAVAVRRSLAVVLLALLGVLLTSGCSVGGGDLATRSSGSSEAASSPDVTGDWTYVSGETKGANNSAHGELKLTVDGKYHDERYLGTEGAFRIGKYTVNSDKLTLESDDGQTEVYGYSLKTETNSDGVKSDTLTLKGDTLSFVLTRKAK